MTGSMLVSNVTKPVPSLRSCLALAGPFLARDLVGPVIRVVTSTATSSVVPPTQIAFGVLALSIAATFVVFVGASSSTRPGAGAGRRSLRPGLLNIELERSLSIFR